MSHNSKQNISPGNWKKLKDVQADFQDHLRKSTLGP